jgi:hypothetical protein
VDTDPVPEAHPTTSAEEESLDRALRCAPADSAPPFGEIRLPPDPSGTPAYDDEHAGPAVRRQAQSE